MITERQIKSRFQRRHLLKLVDEMLKQKLGSGDKPLLELRSGVTKESIVTIISCIVGQGQNKKFSYKTVEILADNKRLSDPLKVQGEDGPNPGFVVCSTKMCDGITIDMFIKRALRKDRWFKDNSAIPVYL